MLDITLTEFAKARYGIDLGSHDTECPFCGARSHHTAWTYTDDDGREMFHCFRCGETFDIYAFVQRIENCSFPEAKKILGEDNIDPDVAYELRKISRQTPKNMVSRYLKRNRMSEKELYLLKKDFREADKEKLVRINAEIGYPLTLFPIKEIKVWVDFETQITLPVDDELEAINADYRRHRKENIEAWEGLEYAERRFYEKVGI